MDVAQGGTAPLTVTYVTSGGVLVDPDNPLLDVLDPAGDVVANDLVPTRDGLGRYRYDYDVAADADLGEWVARWAGTIDGAAAGATEAFTVVEPGQVAGGFGSSVAGVRALIPETPITNNTRPSSTSVAAWLTVHAGRLAHRLGDLTVFDDDTEAHFTTQAANVVHHYVASMTEDAAHPERLPDDNRYAKVLWDRAVELADQLVADVADALAEEPGAADPEAPIGYFPEPVRWLDVAT